MNTSSESLKKKIDLVLLSVVGIAILIPVFVSVILWKPNIREVITEKESRSESLNDYEHLVETQKRRIFENFVDYNSNRYKAEDLAIEINELLKSHEVYSDIPCSSYPASDDTPAQDMLKDLDACLFLVRRTSLDLINEIMALREETLEEAHKNYIQQTAKTCQALDAPDVPQDMKKMKDVLNCP